MGSEIRINVPGKKDAYVDILEQLIAGKVTKEDVVRMTEKASLNMDRFRIGSYSCLADFRIFIGQITEGHSNRFTDYVIHVLKHGNEFLMRSEEVLIFYKGMLLIDKVFPKKPDKNYKKTFDHILKLTKKFIRMKNPHATVEFY